MLKSIFDLTFSFCLIILLAPLMALVSLLILITMGRPIFFIQQRPGLRGRPFYLYKFRTMNDEKDGEGNLLPDQERLTRLGWFLRKTSLDELPQLYNVFRGELSLVGPRPLLMEYLKRYSEEHARRHEVKPGITGWAQVNGRNTLSWEDKFKLDTWYVDHQNFGLDLKIIWLTLVKVLRAEGISGEGTATMTKFMGGEEKDLVIIGAGGFGREASLLVEEINAFSKDSGLRLNLLGFIDDDRSMWGSDQRGYQVLGGWDALGELSSEVAVICVVGDPVVKNKLVQVALSQDRQFINLIHPGVLLAEDVSIGKGVLINKGCLLTTNVQINDHVSINPGCGIGHDSLIGSYTTLMWRVNISGNVSIGESCLVGSGATVLQGKRIGEKCVVGAGAVVTKNLPAGKTAVGIPARSIG